MSQLVRMVAKLPETTVRILTNRRVFYQQQTTAGGEFVEVGGGGNKNVVLESREIASNTSAFFIKRNRRIGRT